MARVVTVQPSNGGHVPGPLTLQLPGGHSRICGLGVHRPAQVLGNAAVGERLGLTDAWIIKRSGIRRRRRADPDETVPVMGASAAGKALAAAGVEPGQVDCVIVATGTHLIQFPAAAVEIARRIEATDAGAFDLTAACAGFPYALAVASDLVRAGGARHVVVVGSERMSDIVDPHDATTAFLFGDGAGAVVVGPSDSPGVGPVRWGADDTRRDAVRMTGYWSRELRSDPERAWPVLGMSGWRVYRWATEHLVGVCRAALAAAGVTTGDLAAFIPHQANDRVTRSLVEGLGLPDGVEVAHDVEEAGNTSAASIPLAMEQLLSTGRVGSGDVALLVGFGSGLVHAAQVVVLP